MFCCCYLANAQTVSEVFKQVAKQYSISKPLQYKTKYVLFKDSESTKAEESYDGKFLKNEGNEIYMKIGDTEIVNLKTAFIKINHTEKAIEISNPVDNYIGDFDIKPLYDLCKIEKFVEYKHYWKIVLLSKSYSSLSYSRIIVEITKDYYLQKQIFYYNTAINFSKDYKNPDPHYPRLEIIYSDLNRNLSNISIFNSNSYFKISDKKQIILAEKLKKYQIIK